MVNTIYEDFAPNKSSDSSASSTVLQTVKVIYLIRCRPSRVPSPSSQTISNPQIHINTIQRADQSHQALFLPLSSQTSNQPCSSRSTSQTSFCPPTSHRRPAASTMYHYAVNYSTKPPQETSTPSPPTATILL